MKKKLSIVVVCLVLFLIGSTDREKLVLKEIDIVYRVAKTNSDLYELETLIKKYLNIFQDSDKILWRLGRTYFKLGENSKLNSEKIYPHGITLHKNKIYIAERKTGKLLVYNTEGEYLNSFTSNIKSGFDPLSINIYEDTYILVPNYVNSSLHIFNMNGKELKIVGGKGESYGKWMFLMNVTEDNKGNIYTVEQDSNRIQLINFSLFFKKNN